MFQSESPNNSLSKINVWHLLVLLIPLAFIGLEIMLINQIYSMKHAAVSIIASALTIFLLLASVSDKHTISSLEPFASTVFTLLVLWMIVAGVVTAWNYLPISLSFGAFAAFYFFTGKSGETCIKSTMQFYKAISIGLVLAASLVCASNFLMFPLKKQYAGFFLNPNTFSAFLVFVFCGALYLLGSAAPSNSKSFRGIVSWAYLVFVIGIVLAMQFYTNSRAGAIASLVSLMLTLLHIIINKRTRGSVVLLALGLVVAVLFIVGLPKLSSLRFSNNSALLNQKIDNVSEEQILKTEEVTDQVSIPAVNNNINGTAESQPIDLDKSSDDTTNISSASSPKQDEDEQLLNQVMKLHKVKAQSSSVSVFAMFSNRIKIYQAYWDNLNLLGNNPKAQAKLKSEYGLSGNTAHNAYLELAYDMGIPAGLLYLIFVVYSLGKTFFLYFCQKRNRVNLLFPILIIVSYALYSLVESTYSPSSLQVWLFLVVQVHVFARSSFNSA